MSPMIFQMFITALLLVGTMRAQQPLLRGTVLDEKGAPLPLAHVWLSETGEHGDKWRVKVRKDGSFVFPVDLAGAYYLSATGVNCSPVTSTVFLRAGDTIVATITMYARTFRESDGTPLVVGAFSKYHCENGIPMRKGSDGIWRADVPCTDSLLQAGIKQTNMLSTLSATGSEAFCISSDQAFAMPGGAAMSYNAVVRTRGGIAHVEFDPSTLPSRGQGSIITFSDRFHQVMHACHKEYNGMSGYGMSSSEAFKRMRRATLDKARIEDAIERTDDESGKYDDPMIRSCLAVHRLRLQDLLSPVTEAQAAACFAVIPAAAPLWGAFPETFAVALAALTDEHALLASLDGYLAAHTGRNAGACALFSLLEDATAQRRQKRFAALYERFTKQYPHSEYQRFLSSDYLSSASSPGATCPVFSARMRDDSSRVISNESVRGKVTLLWLTMPGQWEQEDRLKHLRALHNKYSNAGFTLVSVHCLREQKGENERTYPEPDMPWQRAALPDYSKVPLVQALRIWTFPYIVLLDNSGAILATSAGLRDDDALDDLIAEATKK